MDGFLPFSERDNPTIVPSTCSVLHNTSTVMFAFASDISGLNVQFSVMEPKHWSPSSMPGSSVIVSTPKFGFDDPVYVTLHASSAISFLE